jgi:hypothetical protein
MSGITFYDGKVSEEGDELYYKVRGDGKSILFIAPAGGNGDGYYPVACILAGEYKVRHIRQARKYPPEVQKKFQRQTSSCRTATDTQSGMVCTPL